MNSAVWHNELLLRGAGDGQTVVGLSPLCVAVQHKVRLHAPQRVVELLLLGKEEVLELVGPELSCRMVELKGELVAGQLEAQRPGLRAVAPRPFEHVNVLQTLKLAKHTKHHAQLCIEAVRRDKETVKLLHLVLLVKQLGQTQMLLAFWHTPAHPLTAIVRQF